MCRLHFPVARKRGYSRKPPLVTELVWQNILKGLSQSLLCVCSGVHLVAFEKSACLE